MSISEIAELKRDLSRNVEALGRMIDSKNVENQSCEAMTALRDALNDSAETVQIIRDLTYNLHP